MEERGEGQPFVLLHGGAGPQSVGRFAQLLAGQGHNRVLTPTHPGFGGTPRPDGLDSVAGLAATYLTLISELGLEDVTLIGNSLGGWIAAEMALLGSPRDVPLVVPPPVARKALDHGFRNVTVLEPWQHQYRRRDGHGLPTRPGTAAGATFGLAVSAGGLFMPLLGLVADHHGPREALIVLTVIPVIAIVVSAALREPGGSDHPEPNPAGPPSSPAPERTHGQPGNAAPLSGHELPAGASELRGKRSRSAARGARTGSGPFGCPTPRKRRSTS